ncbi:putative multi-domain containing protein [Aduncisulcus paluster]|uniref:Multi-domain containing protein n=1 Tax=Aduncisulcus paluster TaxID=2918883 RepID=A0ABQ5K3M6_9EUKA|nr:putative multi-domain containing protein [Aduncisulcus paluster]
MKLLSTQRQFSDYPDKLELERSIHLDFILGRLDGLSRWKTGLHTTRPFLTFWLCNSLAMLDQLAPVIKTRVLDSLKAWHLPGGGFATTFSPHAASIYSSMNCLALCACSPKDFEYFDSKALYRVLEELHNPDGSFRSEIDGETDPRITYCCVISAYLAGIDVTVDPLFSKTHEYIKSCQTYEGGFTTRRGGEAHAGYTYCSIATLSLLQKLECIDITRLSFWLVQRQMDIEGGFNGRTHKLVDGCYSFWVGASHSLLSKFFVKQAHDDIVKHSSESSSMSEGSDGAELPMSVPCMSFDPDKPFYSIPAFSGDMLIAQERVQEYILVCCQGSNGGLRDKPPKYPDEYHTCYCLSGLSLTQHGSGTVKFDDGETIKAEEVILGDPSNRLQEIDPIFNIPIGCAEKLHRMMQKR